MAKEYIEREALPLKKFTQTAQMFQDDIIAAIGTDFMQNIAESENKELFEIINAIQKAPTADVVEVTYCRDCTHCDPENKHCDHPMGTSLPVPRKDTDFCSYGERKSNEKIC